MLYINYFDVNIVIYIHIHIYTILKERQSFIHSSYFSSSSSLLIHKKGDEGGHHTTLERSLLVCIGFDTRQHTHCIEY